MSRQFHLKTTKKSNKNCVKLHIKPNFKHKLKFEFRKKQKKNHSTTKLLISENVFCFKNSLNK